MKKPKDQCITIVSDKIIKFEEKRSIAYFNNHSKIGLTKVCVDSCEFRESSSVRCDFALICDKKARFIELKGSDIEHAALQLKTTINYFNIKPNELAIEAFVISQQVPLTSTRIQTIKREFRKSLNALLTIKNSPFRGEL